MLHHVVIAFWLCDSVFFKPIVKADKRALTSTPFIHVSSALMRSVSSLSHWNCEAYTAGDRENITNAPHERMRARQCLVRVAQSPANRCVVVRCRQVTMLCTFYRPSLPVRPVRESTAAAGCFELIPSPLNFVWCCTHAGCVRLCCYLGFVPCMMFGLLTRKNCVNLDTHAFWLSGRTVPVLRHFDDSFFLFPGIDFRST